MKNYQVIKAKNGEEGIAKITHNPDIILLDIGMPGKDGIEVCKVIRNLVNCPILFLTAKIEDTDKINGLKVGGDDYIVKPFIMGELEARVEAHLRREKRLLQAQASKIIGSLKINYSERIIYFKHQEIIFPKKEFDIIELLSLNIGQIFDKEYIYEKLWDYNSEGDSRVIAEHIRRIRKKFSDVTTDSYIETVWGMGYKWKK